MGTESRLERNSARSSAEEGEGAEIYAGIARSRLLSEDFDLRGSCEAWLDVWPVILEYAQLHDLHSLTAVEVQLPREQIIRDCQWEFEEALWCAGQLDPTFWERGAIYFEQYLDQFTSERRSVLESTRRALGTTVAALERYDRADELFGMWLDVDPRWGTGWTGWAACYLFTDGFRDEERAEHLLQQGLAVPGVRDKADIHRELRALYRATGRDAEAAQARASDHETPDREQNLRSVSVPHRSTKVGRNQVCPCGSGKKHKKCCGRGGSK